jgi:hypothetical protein
VTRLRPSRGSARRIVGAALLALLLAQWLALAHAVLHTAQVRASLAFADAAAVKVDFFAHTAGGSECRLVDQLLSAAGAPDVPALEGGPPPDAPVAAPSESPCGRSAARPYEARAPPRA